ncbi:hypothetical protein SISNIDRAFT_351309 [Sistotremastrum niveocremeum HHB9708]|uniref:Myb/SANT-like domain-containing protein n=1 Tax=Sistotremastrum niveocremeum HHB9708 TaxID=1314777 RepID=A0A164X0L4_9AGAM|nr:hypothetical protein SISNIDRAFT_351309 [Sistotremastrum niveocremeum HHB9708]
MPPAPAPSIKPDVPVAAAASQLDTKRKRTPAYRWDANGCEKIWELIAILEDDDFRKVIFGKADADDNTSGESKTSVFKRMALKLFPDEATDAPPAKMTELGNRVKNKYEALSKEYKRQAAKFYYTGNGIDGEGGVEVEDGILRFYISPEGPDHDTPSDAQNLWDSVCKEFPFYEALHRILAAKANIVPINITRGVGPQGAVTIYPQEPSDTEDTPAPPSHIPPATLNPVPIYREAPTTDLPNLLENGWDSLNQDIATFLKEFPSTQSADAPTIHAPLMNAPALHVPLANQESQVPVNKASVSAVTKKSDAKPTQVLGNKSGNKNGKRKKTEPNTPLIFSPTFSGSSLRLASEQ